VLPSFSIFSFNRLSSFFSLFHFRGLQIVSRAHSREKLQRFYWSFSSKKEKIGGTLPRYVEKCRVSCWRSSSHSGNQDHLPPDNLIFDLRRSENPAARGYRSTKRSVITDFVSRPPYFFEAEFFSPEEQLANLCDGIRAVIYEHRDRVRKDWRIRSQLCLSDKRLYIYVLSGYVISFDT